MPVYVRVGELDGAAPPAWSQEIVDAVGNGTLDVVPDTGHLLLLEDYAATAAAVRDALVTAAG